MEDCAIASRAGFDTEVRGGGRGSRARSATSVWIAHLAQRFFERRQIAGLSGDTPCTAGANDKGDVADIRRHEGATGLQRLEEKDRQSFELRDQTCDIRSQEQVRYVRAER
jgi:hypothetical protein